MKEGFFLTSKNFFLKSPNPSPKVKYRFVDFFTIAILKCFN